MNKKRKGFTLTELIIVMAIIVVLSATLAPNIVGYMNEAKKTAAVEEARQIVTAVDSYNATNSSSDYIDEDALFSSFKSKIESVGYLEVDDITYVGDSLTYKDLYNIVRGRQEFSIDENSITLVKSQKQSS